MTFGRLLVIFIGFIIFIVILVALFGHGGKKPITPLNPIQPLPDYATTDAEVSFTSDGIINGDELHRQIRITIGQNSRAIDIIQGYSGQVIETHDFYNTSDAFGVFLHAINNTGFIAKNKSKVSSSETGECPTGFRYVFDLNNDGTDLSRLWTSSCGIGDWGGDLGAMQTLFQDQIPNYDTLTNSVNLQATDTQ